ncbi:MAG: permease [Conexibacteraceae bacterium]|nr:permease [Conexibacteraceae bacterium]
MSVVWHGIRDSLLMAWAVWWALVLGFFISAIVQAWVPRERIEGLLSGSGARQTAWATGLGAASSSCSYAAIAIAKSLFQKGASAASALAFQFASTNVVWELGLVLWVLIGWQFTLAEYLGGIVMIVLMTVLLRVFVSPALERRAREHALQADTGHQHHAAGEQLPWRQRLTTPSAWSDVAHNFRGDWQMLWKEIAIGFLLAGFVAQLGNHFFESLFIRNAPAPLPAIQNVIVGPIIAVASFVCSVGNVPLAAVLWSGGISFGGVLAFLFADLIVLPILAIYRKYYGARFAIRITALMFVTIVIAALVVGGIFSAAGLIPSGPRPTRADIFSSIHVDYKLALNVLGLAIFTAMFWLTARRGATDPVCGMSVDRSKAARSQFEGETYYFCSNHCRQAFEADPLGYLRRKNRRATPDSVSERTRWRDNAPPASGTERR